MGASLADAEDPGSRTRTRTGIAGVKGRHPSVRRSGNARPLAGAACGSRTHIASMARSHPALERMPRIAGLPAEAAGEGWSAWVDSNHRPPASGAGALVRLSYTPCAGAKGWDRT